MKRHKLENLRDIVEEINKFVKEVENNQTCNKEKDFFNI